MDSIPLDVPEKQCYYCKQYKPATSEFFYGDKSKKDRLSNRCKICDRAHYIKRHPPKSVKTKPTADVPDGYKYCPNCLQTKPATLEYFNSNKLKRDHLELHCKECRKTLRPRKRPLLSVAPEGYKRCRQCMDAKPATKEYFYADKNRPYGITDYCKECLQARYRKHPPKPPVPNGYKRCTGCGEIKPKTPEYFYQKIETGMCKPCYNQRSKQNYIEHREQVKARHKVYRKANEDVIRERFRRYRERNRDQLREKQRIYNAANPEIKRIASRKRRALKKGNGGTHTIRDIRRQYTAQKGRCYYCSKKVGNKYHVDHVIPLSRGGTNDPSNLVIACPTCNDRKFNKFLHEWPEGGRLL